MIPGDKIVKVQVTRNIFQRRSDCGDLKVWVRAEGRKSFNIRNLREQDIEQFLSALEQVGK